MRTIHRGLLQLIKSSLTGQAQPLPEGFTLEAAQNIIHSQSLAPLIYPGAINCGIPNKTELMQKYQVHYFRHLVTSDRQIRAVQQICSAFEENGIEYMLLKGYNLKKLYPKPEMRSMGDADILIRLEQYEQIHPIMRSLSFRIVFESLHDYAWENDALYVELHKRLFSKNEGSFYTFFGEGWDKAVKQEDGQYAMSPEDEFGYLFTHMAKHFRYSGIGIKHFVDLYVYRYAHPEMDEEKIEQAMKQMDLLDFYHKVDHSLQVWFEDAPDSAVSDMMLDYVFSGGVFGTTENELYYGELVKNNKRGRGIRNSKIKTLFTALFPPLDAMQQAYNILFKWPILFPLFWPVRWVDRLLHKRGQIGKKLNAFRNMTDDKVAERQRFMDQMGVKFECAED